MEINVYISRARSARIDQGAKANKFISRRNRASELACSVRTDLVLFFKFIDLACGLVYKPAN